MPASNQNKEGKVKFWLPVLLCMAVIFIFSSIPGKLMPRLFNHQDVLFHLSAYLVLGFFFSRALKKSYSNMTRARIIVYAGLFGIIYGFSDEWHQLYVPYRSVSGMDLFVDAVGSLLGSLIYR